MTPSKNPPVFQTAGCNQKPTSGLEDHLDQAVVCIEENPSSSEDMLNHRQEPAADIRWLLAKAGSTISAQQFLTPTELSEGQRYRHPGRFQQWLLGRAAAKHLLVKHAQQLGLVACSQADFEIRRTPDGWPQVFGRNGEVLPISLTISHTDDLAFCALCSEQKGTPGADLERVAPKPQSMQEDFYTQAERNWLSTISKSEQAKAATLIWCVKEAVLKAIRTGLKENTKIVEVDIADFSTHGQTGWKQAQARIKQGTSLRVWWRYYSDQNLILAMTRL